MTTASNPFPVLPGGVDPAVVRGIRQASRATGADFGLLMAQAAQESGFQPAAEATGSSAAGLFQFIESTWLDMVRRFGAKHGIGALAQQVGVDASGRPTVADPTTRRHILALRKDPRLSAALAGEYTRMNGAEVERALGRPVGRGELYLAHFLGAAGATAFLKAVERDGGLRAADLLPEAAAANRGIFYDGATGRPRTVGEIYRSLATRIEEEARDFARDYAGLGTMEGKDGESRTAGPGGHPAAGGAPFAPRLAGSGGYVSEPLAAMLNAIALAALKLVSDDASPAGHPPPRDRRPL